MQRYSFGPLIRDGHIDFRLWAPLQQKVLLKIVGQADRAMRPLPGGWHAIDVEYGSQALRYAFQLQDGRLVPDPASRFQPEGPHGMSEIVSLEHYAWQVPDWSGRPWEETVIYELHVGTFTDAGTFPAAISKLDHLAGLGVTALQLMPLNEFSGRYGWGYDGVLPYAVFHPYGRPEDLQRLIDEAHRRGLSVFVDVVYNHFGPDGNFMPSYAPLFTDRHSSTWGEGINLDGEGSRTVRDFFIENALYWLDLYRFDGIRFDAVHALQDDSDTHFLTELAMRVRAAFPERHIHLIVENEENDSDLLARDAAGNPTLFTAQWNDDIHHVLHAAATGEDFGYYADYADDPSKLGRALAEGFVFQGEEMPYRGSPRGKPSTRLPPTAFVSFIQNHDQIGNRAQGDRLGVSAAADRMRALAAIYLLAPQVPMIFMGEEWDSNRPFPYFSDVEDDLKHAVREGRRKELAGLPGFDAATGEIPDPTAFETFVAAKLEWSGIAENAGHLDHYRALLRIRHLRIVPLLSRLKTAGRWNRRDRLVEVTWAGEDGCRLRLSTNLTSKPMPSGGVKEGELLWSEGKITPEAFGPWSVRWSLSAGTNLDATG